MISQPCRMFFEETKHTNPNTAVLIYSSDSAELSLFRMSRDHQLIGPCNRNTNYRDYSHTEDEKLELSSLAYLHFDRGGNSMLSTFYPSKLLLCRIFHYDHHHR